MCRRVCGLEERKGLVRQNTMRDGGEQVGGKLKSKFE